MQNMKTLKYVSLTLILLKKIAHWADEFSTDVWGKCLLKFVRLDCHPKKINSEFFKNAPASLRNKK